MTTFETLRFHEDKKIHKLLLNMLLKEDLYNDFFFFTTKNQNIFKRNPYEIFPDMGYGGTKLDSIKAKWAAYAVPATKSHITEMYDQLGRAMVESGRFTSLKIHKDSDGKCCGIYVKKRDITIGDTFQRFIASNEKLKNLVKSSLPPLYGYGCGNDYIFLHIKGFNTDIIEQQ